MKRNRVMKKKSVKLRENKGTKNEGKKAIEHHDQYKF